MRDVISDAYIFQHFFGKSRTGESGISVLYLVYVVYFQKMHDAAGQPVAEFSLEAKGTAHLLF